MCGRYTVTDNKADDLTDRFNAILSTKEPVEDGCGRETIERERDVFDGNREKLVEAAFRTAGARLP